MLLDVVCGQLVVPDFQQFSDELVEIYDKVQTEKTCQGGAVMDKQAFLAKVDPDKFGMGVCTTSGQQFSYGDAEDEFAVQAASRPLLYCIVQELYGIDEVHSHMGSVPSNQAYNELSVNPGKTPLNPLDNAGALVCHSMIMPEGTETQRFETVYDFWKRCAGGSDKSVGFSNSCYLSEMDTSDRNYAIAYMLKQEGAFPNQKGAKGQGFNQEEVDKVMRLHGMDGSISIDCEKMSVVAATLANGGVCPLTGDRVFSTQAVTNCLSVMLSSGLHNYSGSFALEVGFPSAGSVSGVVMVVIPGVLGMCLWAPKVEAAISVKGRYACECLGQRFAFHSLGKIPGVVQELKLKDIRSHDVSGIGLKVSSLAEHASNGDIQAMVNLINLGVDATMGDYDKRTAMHLACAEGHLNIVRYLLEEVFPQAAQDVKLLINARDRWHGTPLSDAVRGGHQHVVEYLAPLGATE